MPGAVKKKEWQVPHTELFQHKAVISSHLQVTVYQNTGTKVEFKSRRQQWSFSR